MWLLPDWWPLFSLFALIGILVFGAPWGIWEILHPLHLDLNTADDATVVYEFRDRAYAEEFAALNNAQTDAEPEKGEETE